MPVPTARTGTVAPSPSAGGWPAAGGNPGRSEPDGAPGPFPAPMASGLAGRHNDAVTISPDLGQPLAGAVENLLARQDASGRWEGEVAWNTMLLSRSMC